MTGFHVPWTEILIFLFNFPRWFLVIFEQCGDNCKLNLFLKRKVGVTERPRSLHSSKAITMAICPIIVHFCAWRARSMHDVACEFARAAMRSKDAQKQLARTSLKPVPTGGRRIFIFACKIDWEKIALKWIKDCFNCLETPLAALSVVGRLSFYTYFLSLKIYSDFLE